MTLVDLLPSSRSSLYSRLEVGLWPITAQPTPGGGVTVGGVSLTEVAARFGTPVQVLDTADIRARCRSYHCALPDAEIAYAGHAFLCRAMARLVKPNLLDLCRRAWLVGLHCHLGWQIAGVAGFELAIHRMSELLAECARRYGIRLTELDLGGGHGAGEFDLLGFARRVPVALSLECARYGIPWPRLTLEPGRAIVSRARVSVYRVAVVKRVGDGQRVIAVSGGMSDNPRPAPYRARYPVRVIGREVTAPLRPATVIARHSESEDSLALDVSLPDDVHAGDLLAVPGSGAYHHSMASACNLVGRPAVVALAGGRADLLVRGETEEDLLSRDVGC